jgi:hypothetical protein
MGAASSPEADLLRKPYQKKVCGGGLWCLTSQQYFSYFVAVSFIGGGNQSSQRKPLTCRKSLTNFIT